ncbi:MAG: hypothetical protein J6D08_06120 [Lachnospiraceae bacterium]|nr:hypothetical protein [Lachnospiraceae bacterium]
MKEKKITGADYLYLALYAFAGVGMELVLLYIIEPFFGMKTGAYTTPQHIIHWVLTCIVWLGAGLFLIQLAKKKYAFDLLECKSSLRLWQWVGIILCMVISAAAHYAQWEGFKPLLEYQSNGAVKFVFQYIYYVFESFLLSLIVIFGQKAFEMWFHNDKIPYGGIVLALTWGLMHIVTKSSIEVGLLTALSGFLYGSAYLVAGKDYRKTLPLMCFMFMV